MLEQMEVAQAISVAMVHAATWRGRGEEQTANWWLEVRDELVAVGEQDAKEGRGAA